MTDRRTMLTPRIHAGAAVATRTWFLLRCAILAFPAVLFTTCQSPLTTPPEVEHLVTVIVQDDSRLPLPNIPVEAYSGVVPAASSLLQSRVTDASGRAGFRLRLPASGGRFVFVAGDTRTGKVVRETNLLCRDTTLLIVLTGAQIPCGGTLPDTITFVDACAKSMNGAEHPDSIEHRYTSLCDEALVITYPSVDDPALRVQVIVFDNNGNRVNGNSFTIPPRGSFSVRVVYTPQTTGTFTRNILFTATGAATNSAVSLLITGNAVNCDNCTCTDQFFFLNLGSVVVGPPDSISLFQGEVNVNRTICNRNDVLIRNFPSNSPFTLLSTTTVGIPPSRGQVVSIRFTPTAEGRFVDSLVFESTYLPSGTKCRFTIVVRAEGTSPRCCLDPIASRNLTVDNTTVPPTYTITLSTDATTPIAGSICYFNCGSGGWVTVSRPAVQTASGFSIPDMKFNIAARIRGGETACFPVVFTPTEQLIWPNGRGRGPGTVDFQTSFSVIGCSPARINVVAHVDTVPGLFSTCIYRWDQNKFNGFSFTPVETKGAFIIDLGADDPSQAMTTDLAFLSGPGGVLSGNVRIRSGWKLIRNGVNNQNDFTYDMIRLWPEFPTLKSGPFQTSEFTTLALYSVYVMRVERNGIFYDALVRVREISDDGQKQKLCIDVLFPL